MRSKRAAFIALAMAIAACQQSIDKPSEELVERVEGQILESVSCVKSLDRWERHYRFAGHDGPIIGGIYERFHDDRFVEFDLFEAGVPEVRAGRIIEEPSMYLMHINTRAVDGRYEVATGRIEHSGCYWTCSPSAHRGSTCG